VEREEMMMSNRQRETKERKQKERTRLMTVGAFGSKMWLFPNSVHLWWWNCALEKSIKKKRTYQTRATEPRQSWKDSVICSERTQTMQ